MLILKAATHYGLHACLQVVHAEANALLNKNAAHVAGAVSETCAA